MTILLRGNSEHPTSPHASILDAIFRYATLAAERWRMELAVPKVQVHILPHHRPIERKLQARRRQRDGSRSRL